MIGFLSKRPIVLVLLSAGLFPGAARAQSGNWISNATGTYDWGDAGNWLGGAVADGADHTATFATAGLTGPMTVSLDTARTIGSLVFDNPTNSFGWNVTGAATLTLSNSASAGPTIAVNNTAITATIAAPLAGSFAKTGSGTLTVAAAAPALSPGTNLAMTAGTLNVDAANAFGPSPNVTITGGIVNLNNPSGFGTTPNVALISGILNLATGLNPTLPSLSGAPGSLGGGAVILNGNTLTLGGATATYGGTIEDGSAAGRLVKNGAGTQTLTGLNTFSGGVTINSGALAVTTPVALGTGPVTLNGGFLSLTAAPASGSLTINNFGQPSGRLGNGSAKFTAANQLQLTKNSGDSGSYWIRTSGSYLPFALRFTYTVVAASSTPADGFTVGFQNIPSPYPATGGYSALGGGGAGKGYSGISPSAAVQFNIYPANTIGGLGSGLGVLTNGANPAASPVPSTFPVNLGAVNNPTNVTITYDGTNIRVFLVQGQNVYSSPPMPLDIAGNVVGDYEPYFGFTGGTGSGGSTAQQQITNLQYNIPNYTTYANNVTVGGPSATIQVAATSLASAVTMGNVSFAVPSANLIVAADPGTPVNQQYNLTLGAVALNGPTTFSVVNNGVGNYGAGTLTLGVVSNGAGTGSLIKAGSGTLMLPAVSTYTGGTTVSGGVLMPANALGSATGTGPVIVAAGGTLRGGDGGGFANPFADSTKAFVGGPVTVQAGGILYPGGNGAGLLTVGGGINFQSDAIWQVFLTTENPRSGPQPADVNTNTRVVTPLDILFGGTLRLWIDGALLTYSAGTVYDFHIGRDDGMAAALPTSVAFLPFDFLPPANPADFSLTRSADGRDLILTYAPAGVPEPGTLALVAAAAGAWIVRRRKHKNPQIP
jgi:autotransporter-associated beta strand protein